MRPQRLISLIALAFAIVGASFFTTLWLFDNMWSPKYELVEVFQAKDLLSLTGRLNERGARVAVEGIDKPNFVTAGPYVRLKKGSYQIVTYYSSSAASTQSIGTWDIIRGQSPITNGSLKGTDGKITTMSVYFDAPDLTPISYEFRNNWNGSKDIEIDKIELFARR